MSRTRVLAYASTALIGGGLALWSVPLGVVVTGALLWVDTHVVWMPSSARRRSS